MKKLYLRIASEHLESLRKYLNSVQAQDIVLIPINESAQYYRDALVCVSFSAFAVEYAISELLWWRALFQTPRKDRPNLIKQISDMRTIPERLALLRRFTKLLDALFLDMKNLFDLRNRIVHCRVEYSHSVRTVYEVDRKNKKIRRVRKFVRDLILPGVDSEFLMRAEWCYLVANRAVELLAQERDSPEWPIQP